MDDFFPSVENQRPPKSRNYQNPDRVKEVVPHKGTTPFTADSLSTKWLTILSLEMQGHTKTDIAGMVGMSISSICDITLDPRYIEARDKRLAELDREFFEMKPAAFGALRKALDSADENVALRASEVWFKGASFGGYSKEPAQATNLTAEDVARQLLQINADNVQINIKTGE